ncbi:hypothetical protein FHS04_000126 [Mesoflavibacter sabulilitoris]|uniref:Histidyl-tRNA synthetase n=1 Tax=Mesoflavibacter zeaxanthinifaciens subsp. sabulilitoris TaxID=1520893 RepID=A0A2T1NKJ5_9FLAO|nr:DUF6495 family protein [Mesoflavibacter zeaxanthinifaciens]MBB3122638.1 hypothetical protein [Mesoflavibacter zeaxanthinifaciens subsp. sabulilitoris]PSG93409.1 hypothetical protein C7H61_02540 [Mesoflavibacter zeaxanthinifaciens subsp. sabulilitoris]
MKYARLTKEQFEELHQEFINFLATQSITAEEWQTIKTEKPEVAEQELDVFSDLVWEGVLTAAKYLEHISPKNIHLFALNDDHMHLIGIKIEKEDVDVTTQEGFNWLRNNLMDESVEFAQAKKEYSDDKNLDKFALIQQGSNITKGELYEYMNNLIN